MTSSLVLLDSCAVINLFATRRMRDLLAVLPGTIAIADMAARESHYVRRGGSGDDAEERDPVDLGAMISAGLIAVLSTDDEAELLTFLDFSLEVDQGEAMTAAFAIHRRATVITDDRKAIRLLIAQDVPILSTLDVVRNWCDQTSASMHVQSELLINIRERARYEPRRHHPHRTWWEATIGPYRRP